MCEFQVSFSSLKFKGHIGLSVGFWGYRLKCLEEPVFTAAPKSMLTEFGIHHRLESFKGNSALLLRFSK